MRWSIRSVNLAGRVPKSIRAKLLLCFVGLASVPTLVVGVWAASEVGSAVRARALADLANNAEDQVRAIELLDASIEDDLRHLAVHPAFRQFRQESRSRMREATREAVEAAFISFSQGRRAYWQGRYIDGATGREAIRVDYGDSRPVLVAQHALQDQSDRSYVREGLRLTPSELYISPMDFGSEPGRVEDPVQPIVRYVLALGDEPRADGLLVVSLLAEHLLASLDPRLFQGEGRVILLDDRGTYLASSDDSVVSPTVLGDRTLAADEPLEVVERVLSGVGGSVWAAGGTAYNLPREFLRGVFRQPGARPPSGMAYGFWPIRNRTARDSGRHWVLAVAVPEVELVGAAARGGDRAIVLGALLSSLLAAILGVLGAWRLSRPLRDLSLAADRVASGDFSTRVSCETNDEIEHLADRFNEMTERLGLDQAALARWNEELRHAVDERTRQLAQEKEKLAGVVAGMDAGLCLLDRDRRVLWANRTLQSEYGDDLEGRSCTEVFKCVEPCAGCPGAEVLLSHTVVRRVIKQPHADGERHVQVVAAPVHDAGGELTHVVGLFTDVTESVRREEAVFRAERLSALGLLSASVSHEVANPLAAIKTSLQALMEGPIGKARVHRFAERAVAEVDRLTVFLRTFATFARPRPPERDRVDLMEAVRDTAALVEHALRARHLRLELALEPATVLADGGQIRQVLLNLLLNAVEASPDGGRLTLVVRSATLDGTPAAAFEVADEGPGMDDDTRRRIFDPFFSTKPAGAGLGLSVVHQIVTEHSGRVEVDTAVGKGARFRVILPGMAASMPAPLTAAEA